MNTIIAQIVFAGLATSIVWFLLGGLLYMNPIVAKVYKRYANEPVMKKYASQRHYLMHMYLWGILVPSLLAAVVFYFISPVFAEALWVKVMAFALILIGLNTVPKLLEMWVQTLYPNKLLLIEGINGIIASFTMALTLSLML